MDMIVTHYSTLSLSESNVLVGTPHYFLATHSNTFTWLNVSFLLSVVNLCPLWYTLYSSGNKRSNSILTAILYLHFLWFFKTKIVHTTWLWDTFFYFLWYTSFSYVEITKRTLQNSSYIMMLSELCNRILTYLSMELLVEKNILLSSEI
jgi:hypothetical protein